MPLKVGILYIAIGRYEVFWETFFASAKAHFKPGNSETNLHFYIYTDRPSAFPVSDSITIIEQVDLGWPGNTLYRFRLFSDSKHLLSSCDYVYFFNANMLFIAQVGEEFLPTVEQPLVMVHHPGFVAKARSEFTYEDDTRSTACVRPDEGRYYVMGGVNGGETQAFLAMSHQLRLKIEEDERNGLIAKWHDESHLNRFAIDHETSITFLSADYGWPEGKSGNRCAKIIIRDKKKHGGHAFLRGQQTKRGFVRNMLAKWTK